MTKLDTGLTNAIHYPCKGKINLAPRPNGQANLDEAEKMIQWWGSKLGDQD